MAVYTMTFQDFFDAGFKIGDYPIWDESYRNVLNDKIKNHYLFREIGQETPGRFKHYLDTKLNEIMPYYNQLYNTTLKEYDISVVSETSETYNANAQTDSESSSTASTEQSGSVENSSSSSSEANGTGTSKNTGTSNNTATYDNSTTNTNEGVYSLTDNRESETPEGALTLTDNGQLSAGYLTRASTNRTEQGGSSESKHTGTDTTVNDNESNSESTSSSTGTANAESTSSSTATGNTEASQTAKINNTSDYLKNITVKNPNLAVNTIEKLRKNIINIDMMIIEELGELFMMVY